MAHDVRVHDAGKLITGLTILGLGVLFLLDNFQVLNVHDYWRYWPVVLVAVGVSKLVQACSPIGSRLWGAGFVVAGLLLLAHNLDFITWNVWDLWPVLLVAAGLGIAWRALGRGREHDLPHGPGSGTSSSSSIVPAEGGGGATPVGTAAASPGSQDSRLEAFVLLGGGERRLISQDFRGGNVTAILGACEVDLKQAAIAGGDVVLDTFAFWGGIEIHVPKTWNVVVAGTPILGGFGNNTVSPDGSPAGTLVVRGVALMGGVEINNE